MTAALRAAALLAVLAVRATASGAQAVDPYMRATDLEQRGDLKGAALAYRQALGGVNAESALLDYERVCADAGCTDSVIALVDSLVRARPSWTLARSVQLRALRMAGRAPEARQAFERWTATEPRSVVPFREYARLLIQAGASSEADSVLRRGRAIGGARDLALEVAQQRAAAGQWVASAQSWREALLAQPYLVQATMFALRPAAADSRDSVIAELLEPTASPAARNAAAALQLAWGAPNEAWTTLASLTPDDSAIAAWRDFGERAEDARAWAAARDAFGAVFRARRQAADGARAAAAALAAGDATGALALAQAARGGRDSSASVRLVAPVQVRALAQLGRAEEAERVASEAGAAMPAEEREALAREAAAAWVRRGDIARARAALARAGGDDEVSGLLALYEGDLATARPLLRRPSATSADVVLAVAVLGRTTATRAPIVGDAFLRLARGDSAGAADAFERAMTEVGDAAPALLLEAARLRAARGDAAGATRDWQRLLTDYATSAEAPEADLAWGQALARGGDSAGAAARFEHLLVSFPDSALAPQARAARAALGGS